MSSTVRGEQPAASARAAEVSAWSRRRTKAARKPGRDSRTRVAPSPLYERRGSDLVIEVPVTYPEAALGATVEVPTPYGERLSLKVAPGSEDGKLLRMRGHGAPKLNEQGKGDLLARLKVTVPQRLTKAEREALEKLQKVSRENPRERLS